MSRLKWLMERSLTQTLAHKLGLSVNQVYHRYRATLQTDQGPRAGLHVIVEGGAGRKPLVATWGGASLARRTTAILNDAPLSLSILAPRTELEQRLLADTCELCDSREHIQVHHVRALKDLRRKGQAERPRWVKLMAARSAKRWSSASWTSHHLRAGYSERRKPGAGRGGQKRIGNGTSLAAYSTLPLSWWPGLATMHQPTSQARRTTPTECCRGRGTPGRSRTARR